MFGGPTYHLAGNKDANYQKEQQVDHSHTLSAEDAVKPHARHRREGGDRVQAVVLAVDRAAVTSTVNAAKVAPAEVPKRISLPSRLPKC